MKIVGEGLVELCEIQLFGFPPFFMVGQTFLSEFIEQAGMPVQPLSSKHIGLPLQEIESPLVLR